MFFTIGIKADALYPTVTSNVTLWVEVSITLKGRAHYVNTLKGARHYCLSVWFNLGHTSLALDFE